MQLLSHSFKQELQQFMSANRIFDASLRDRLRKREQAAMNYAGSSVLAALTFPCFITGPWYQATLIYLPGRDFRNHSLHIQALPFCCLFLSFTFCYKFPQIHDAGFKVNLQREPGDI